MKRLVVSPLLWLRSTHKGIGCTAHHHLGSRADGAPIGAPLSGIVSKKPLTCSNLSISQQSQGRNVLKGFRTPAWSADRMQMLPTMPVQRYKEHFYSTRRGLQAYAAPRNALNLKPRVVLYDGVCHLCNAGVKWILKVDKKKSISFCALQSRAAEPYLLLCGITREDVLRRFVFIEGPNSCHQASTAALKVASYLPLPYSALSVFFAIPAPIRDAVYDYVANRRYQWFGKSSECISPTEDVLDRFVDKLEIQERMTEDQDEEQQVEEKS